MAKHQGSHRPTHPGQTMVREPSITHQSRGIFDAQEWITEGERLLASARVTQATSLLKWRVFKTKIDGAKERTAARMWAEALGLPRAAMLLLGYAAEMFLKAVLARACWQCREGMLERATRNFGHDLAAIARHVGFPLEAGDDGKLNLLRTLVTDSARYPLKPKAGTDYFAARSERDSIIWSRSSFRELCTLVQRVRSFAIVIDQDENNPAAAYRWDIDKDGYLVFRHGGNLGPRITWRPSSDQVARKASSIDDMRRLFEGNQVLDAFWDHCILVEDKRQTS